MSEQLWVPGHIFVDEEITLRQPDYSLESEVHAYYNHVKDNRKFLSRTLPWAVDFGYKDAKFEALRYMAEAEAGREAAYSISFNGNFGGMVRLHSRQDNECQLGYWRTPSARTNQDGSRAGVATRAARAMVEFAFHRWDINTIDLHIRPNNAPSIRLAERLGADFVGMTHCRTTGQANQYQVWRRKK